MAYPGKPELGAVVPKYNRMYIVVDPTFPSGPPTYRVSNPDEIPFDSGSNINGVDPIIVTTDGTTKQTQISMDISTLDNRD